MLRPADDFEGIALNGFAFPFYGQFETVPTNAADNFRKPIPADGSGFFKPLNQVLAGRLATRQYAQVGTLVAYVVDQKPQWLPVVAETSSAGGDAETAFKKCGTTLPELQDAWMKWGAEKVGEVGDAGALLPVPPEFATPAASPAEGQ